MSDRSTPVQVRAAAILIYHPNVTPETFVASMKTIETFIQQYEEMEAAPATCNGGLQVPDASQNKE